LDIAKQTQWTYGPVSCNIYPLDDLDTISNEMLGIAEAGSGEDGEKKSKNALNIIVKHKYLKLLMIPRIVDLLHKKWKAYAESFFYRRCLTTGFYIIALTFAVLLRGIGWLSVQDSTWKDSFHGVAGAFKAITMSIVLLGWMYKFKNEMAEFWSSGLSYFQQAGAAFLENALSFSFCMAIPIALICELAGSFNTANFFVSVALLFAWGYTLALLMGFELTGPFVIMIYKMIMSDIARFLIIYLVILVGYSTAFFAIANPVEVGSVWNKMFYDHVYNLFTVLLGNTDFVGFNATIDVSSSYVGFSSLLLLTYIIIITILLLNMLIAMMGDTFNTVKEQSHEEWHLAYAQIIFSIESERPDSFWTDKNPDGNMKNFEPYWTVISAKRYLQVQEVDEGWYQKVKEDTADFADFDIDEDGVVSSAEFAAGMARLRAAKSQKDTKENKSEDRVALGPQDALPGRVADHLTHN